MRPLEILRRNIKIPVFGEAEARTLLGSGSAYHGKIHRLIKSGDLIQLKRGLFALNDQRFQPSTFQVANLLYGPSYISLESALSHYDLIPEAVRSVTSVTSKRPRQMKNHFGLFIYRSIPESSFPFGTLSTEIRGAHVLMATAEKAILDKLYLDYFGSDAISFLTESLRIEESALASLDIDLLKELSLTYKVNTFSLRIQQLCAKLQMGSQ